MVAGNYSCRVMHEIRLHLLVARLKKASYRLTFLLLKQRGFVWLCCKQIQQLLFCCIPDKVAARGGGGSVCCRIKLQEICKYYNLKARVKCPRNRSRSHSKKTTACVCVWKTRRGYLCKKNTITQEKKRSKHPFRFLKKYNKARWKQKAHKLSRARQREKRVRESGSVRASLCCTLAKCQLHPIVHEAVYKETKG